MLWCWSCKERTSCSDYIAHYGSNADMYRLVMHEKECREAEENVKELEQESCEDCVSRQDILNYIYNDLGLGDEENGKDVEIQMELESFYKYVKSLPPVASQSKTEHCKDCKWWKDSDGIYRRGVEAESQCPINRREVFEGNGYCYMFEPQESEDKE